MASIKNRLDGDRSCTAQQKLRPVKKKENSAANEMIRGKEEGLGLQASRQPGCRERAFDWDGYVRET